MDVSNFQNWQSQEISKLCLSIVDCVNRTAPLSDVITPYKMIRTSNFNHGFINLKDVNYVSEETFKRWTRRSKPKIGDVILTREAPLGEVGMISEDDQIFLGQRLVQYRTNPLLLDPNYLLYYLQSHFAQSQIRAYGSGSTVEHMRVPDSKKIMVLTPDINVQRKIGAILSSLEILISKNNRKIEVLEQMAQLLYREWFVEFRFPGYEKHKFVDSELGKIPEGWTLTKVKNVLKHYIGGGWGNDIKDNTYSKPAYVIRGTDIPRAKIGDFTECPLRFHKQSNFNNRKLIDGDIVFEVSGGSEGQPLGRAVLINNDTLNSFEDDVICASFCKLIRANGNITPEYLFLTLDYWGKTGQLSVYEVQSTGISNYQFEAFIGNVEIILPEKEILEKFSIIAKDFYKHIQILGRINSNLKKTRDLLLPKLISGEIDVSKLDIKTEPN
jgi:type I restriction enzyme S subunit